MSAWELPIDASDPEYDVDVDLDGSLYRLGVRWNERGGYWSLDVSIPDDDTPIVTGMRIVPDWNLLRQFVDTRLPPGRLVCIDSSGRGEAPGYADLGSRVVLVYEDASS